MMWSKVPIVGRTSSPGFLFSLRVSQSWVLLNPSTSPQAELEELVKQEHAKIDSLAEQEKAGESEGAAAEGSAAPEQEKE